jgi:hypothetical protein
LVSVEINKSLISDIETFKENWEKDEYFYGLVGNNLLLREKMMNSLVTFEINDIKQEIELS